VYFGTVTENLAQEMERVGDGKDTRYVPKYRMQDLLTDGYTVSNREQPQGDPLAGIRDSDGATYDEVI
jgi:hypothetical protein